MLTNFINNEVQQLKNKAWEFNRSPALDSAKNLAAKVTEIKTLFDGVFASNYTFDKTDYLKIKSEEIEKIIRNIQTTLIVNSLTPNSKSKELSASVSSTRADLEKLKNTIVIQIAYNNAIVQNKWSRACQ